MYTEIIIGVSIFSVINLKCTVYVEVYQCQSLRSFHWNSSTEHDNVTNIWCEDFCKAAAANYRYSGTKANHCYCGETCPSLEGLRLSFQCSIECPGNTSENCGGLDWNDELVTISKIGLSTETETVAVTNTQATSTPYVSIRESKTADFMNMITNNISLAKVTQSTPSTIRKVFSTTSENENTTISTVITGTSTHATTGMRPRKLLCKCPKRLINTKWHFLDGKNITDAEVKKVVLEDFNKNIKSEISVDKKTVSKEVRKKNSSVNKRKSAQSIGRGCIVFLILPMVFLIAIDILNCCIHFRTRLGGRKRNRIRPISNIQDQKDSSKPLQENVNITESYYARRCGNNFHPDEMKRETYQRRRDDNYQQIKDKWLQYI